MILLVWVQIIEDVLNLFLCNEAFFTFTIGCGLVNSQFLAKEDEEMSWLLWGKTRNCFVSNNSIQSLQLDSLIPWP